MIIIDSLGKYILFTCGVLSMLIVFIFGIRLIVAGIDSIRYKEYKYIDLLAYGLLIIGIAVGTSILVYEQLVFM